MKTAAKVFVILGMILGGILIIPIIVGIFALKQIDEYGKPSIAISILTLILCSPIAGILMLCIEDQKRSYSDRNRFGEAQCDLCGKRSLYVQRCTIKTYLGFQEKNLCPECQIKNQPKPCEVCGAISVNVQPHMIKTSLGPQSKLLCPECKAKINLEQ